MFGLFRAPRDSIRRRIEQQDYTLFAAVTSYSDLQLDYLPRRQKEYAVGYILSVWACNSSSASNISLSEFDYRYIKNLGMNCANFLPNDIQVKVEHVMDELIESGLVPHRTATRKKRSKSKRRSRSSGRQSGKRPER